MLCVWQGLMAMRRRKDLRYTADELCGAALGRTSIQTAPTDSHSLVHSDVLLYSDIHFWLCRAASTDLQGFEAEIIR